jgi:hypothetical protein
MPRQFPGSQLCFRESIAELIQFGQLSDEIGGEVGERRNAVP